MDGWQCFAVSLLACLSGLVLVGPAPPPQSHASTSGQAALASCSPPAIAGCPLLPPDNVWNATIDALPVDANSAAYVSTIGAGRRMHADFGSGVWEGGPIGIPWATVSGTQPKAEVSFYYPAESDPGPYPIPTDAPIEGGPNGEGDRHVLIVDRDHCVLHEVFDFHPDSAGWRAGSGAVFDLKSNALRPQTWTSADAAGLPILPGLVRYEEAVAGEIRHALRFTAPQIPGRTSGRPGTLPLA